MDKRAKALEKRAMREERKNNPTPVVDTAIVDDDASEDEDASEENPDQ